MWTAVRTEKEMFDLILGFAENDSRVRAVVMNGSRANPSAKKDVMQDYDIVYLVDDYESFLAGHKWIDVFGDKLVYQLPDDSELYPNDRRDNGFGYLMQFKDGNRIDLSLAKKEDYYGYCFDDRLSVVLLDKDGFLPKLPEPDESTHRIKKPSLRIFNDCRCEFWWVSPYVAKGLWRGQILFAQKHMEMCIRKELERMLGFYAGAANQFTVSAGKCGDRLRDYIPVDWWQRYLKTYAECDEERVWEALFEAAALFSEVTAKTASLLGFTYSCEWDNNVPKYLRYVKDLERDAETISFSL